MNIKFLESGKHYEGRIYHTRNCGDLEILGEVIYVKPHTLTTHGRWFMVRFINTGYTMVAELHAIANGAVKDRLIPIVANVGYLGSNICLQDEGVMPIYRTWNDMIHRCYDPTDRDYKYYGGIGIKVAPEWFNFTTFLNDVKQLPGYENKILYPDQYQFDKDYLQMNVPKEQRIYSKETCMWISKFDNIKIMGIETRKISPYIGVIYKDHAWCTRYKGAIHGRFTIPEAAAYLYNIIATKHHSEFEKAPILNQVREFSYKELKSLAKNKQRWFNDYPERE